MSDSQPVVLTIAGTDSSGGAGVQADLKTFTALGCYGTSAITAMTAQNTVGVQGVHAPPPEFVRQQIHSVLDDVHIDSIKTGMLYDSENTKAVFQELKEHFTGKTLPPIVCDPVCVSTSGHTLLQPDAVEVMISELFPLTTLITPNKSEAELLLGRITKRSKIETLEDMLDAAWSLLCLGPRAALLKGGHMMMTMKDVERLVAQKPAIRVVSHGFLQENMEILQEHQSKFFSPTDALVLDILCEEDETETIFIRPRIDSKNTHGTGCTLSAAIACGLAQGKTLVDSITEATVFTHNGIITAPKIGRGSGPLNHLHALSRSQIPSRTPEQQYPLTYYLIKNAGATWKQYVEHDFVKLLGKGILDKKNFIHFAKQDYIYLRYYARAYALLAAKASSFGEIETATKTILNVLHELGTHRSMCAQFGVDLEELETAEESDMTTAYGAFILDTGLRGDSSALLMALFACLLGYGEVGLWLIKSSKEDNWVKLAGNPYLRWIEDYSGQDYQNAVKLGMEVIENLAVTDPPSPFRLQQWSDIFTKCTKLERGFWDMAMALS